MSYQAPDVSADISQDEFFLLVLEQFREIQQAFAAGLPKVYTAPPKTPKDGLIVVADGTSWNPGSGVGYYGYYNGTWRFLG